jgi:hypothetical protein
MNAEVAKWAFGGGLLAVFLSSYAMFVILKAYENGQFTKPWVAAEIALLVVGAALGIIMFKLELYANPSLRTFGFPFVAGVFELHDGQWTDFVSPLSLVSCIGNFVVGLMVVQIPLALVLRLYLWARAKNVHA